MRYVMRLDLDRCVACNACVVACIDQNDTDIPRGEQPLRRGMEFGVLLDPEEAKPYRYPTCRHCANPPCAAACPRQCIRKDPGTGFVVARPARCTGCGSCAAACPHDAVRFGADGRIRKCDGCHIRVKNGLLPACVAACAPRALTLEAIPEGDKKGAPPSGSALDADTSNPPAAY